MLPVYIFANNKRMLHKGIKHGSNISASNLLLRKCFCGTHMEPKFLK